MLWKDILIPYIIIVSSLVSTQTVKIQINIETVTIIEKKVLKKPTLKAKMQTCYKIVAGSVCGFPKFVTWVRVSVSGFQNPILSLGSGSGQGRSLEGLSH
jgi:hypothetical protein